MRVGVLGGTFDPIHLGHLHLARRAQSLLGLSRLYFVVAGSPPHKRGRALLDFTHRYTMVALATSSSPRFIPAPVELEPPPSPFSVDTMEKLARRVEPRDLYFIAGGDSLVDVRSWRRAEALLSSYNFVFVARPRSGAFDGVDPRSVLPTAVRAKFRDLRSLPRPALVRELRTPRTGRDRRIYLLDVGAKDISSSEIRSRAGRGAPIGHLVPPAVDGYIQKLEIYGSR